MSTEDLLRDTLHAKADEAAARLTVDDVRRGVLERHRHARRRMVLVAAAAAVLAAVAVPSALLLRPDDGAPSPAPSPGTPSASATSSPSPTAPATLASIRRGADPKVTYLEAGTVHQPDGSTSALPPAADDVTQFTPYHGGWLTVSSTGALTRWDNTGTARAVFDGEAALAVSADQLQTAYDVAGKIHVGVGTGMADGEVTYSTGGGHLVGFVANGVVVTGGDVGGVGYIDRGTRHVVPGLSEADATAAAADLIGGLAPDGVSGRVVTLTGTVLWTSSWQPRALSPDGRYVVAVLAPESEATDLAILDARTGSVLARLSLADRRLSQFGPPVWEATDPAVLLPVHDATGQAVLRLGLDGRVDRATDVAPSTETPAWTFATQP